MYSHFSRFSRSSGNPAFVFLSKHTILSAFSLCSSFLPPATKLGQGYVFTGVCDSVHRGEYLTRSRGVYLVGGVCLVPGGGLPGPGERGVPAQVHPPPLDQVPPQTRYTPLGTGTPPDQVHPQGPGTPPGPGTPLGPGAHPPGPGAHPPGPGTHPRTRHPPILGDTVNAWAVRILLECNLFFRSFQQNITQ